MDLEKQLLSHKYIVLLTKREAVDFLRTEEKLYDCKVSLTIGSDVPDKIQTKVLKHVLYLKTRFPSPPDHVQFALFTLWYVMAALFILLMYAMVGYTPRELMFIYMGASTVLFMNYVALSMIWLFMRINDLRIW